jgi:DNA-binding PadR family transcriptional regulator
MISTSEKILTFVEIHITISVYQISIYKVNLMPKNIEIQKYLPLTEATYYILLTLLEPLHGYAVMQRVQEISKGLVEIGPGTLYGAFSTLEEEHLIEMVKHENRRKSYSLTSKGKRVLLAQIERLRIMTQLGEELLNDPSLLDLRSV